MTIEQWLNYLVKVLLVGLIDFGCNLKRHACAFRDLDGLIQPLLGRDPSQEGEILAGAFEYRASTSRHTVVDRPLPIDIGQRFALRIRN